MVRAVVALSVILGLIVCPLRCLGVFDLCAMAESNAPTCCCEHCKSSTREHSVPSDNDPPGEACQQCLCKGCVVDAAKKISIDQSTFDVSIDFTATDFSHSIVATDRLHYVHFASLAENPLLRSGRFARIAFQSMLL